MDVVMRRRMISSLGAASLAVGITAVLGCGNNASPAVGESPSDDSASAREVEVREDDMTSKDSEQRGAALSLYGLPLGADYGEAVAAAEEMFEVESRALDSHKAEGTIDGIPAEVGLRAREGRLSRVSIALILDEPDEGIESSEPLARLVSELGEPSERTATRARWLVEGFEVTLKREVVHPRGPEGPRVEYAIRAKEGGPPSPGPNPEIQREKEREAEERLKELESPRKRD